MTKTTYCISLLLSVAVFLAGCQAKLSLIEGTQPTKEQRGKIKRVSVESSVGELEVIGANFVAMNVMLGAAWMGGTLLCLPCIIGTLAIGSAIASGIRSNQENEARGMIPTSWIEGEMTERFQRRLTEAKLFDVVAAASSDAVILLRLDKIYIVPNHPDNTTTLFLTGSALMRLATSAVLWQTTATVRSSPLPQSQGEKGALLKQEFQRVLDKLSSRLASELIYAY